MKLLVSDYDNTFYISDNDINNNINLTKKFMNKNLFVIATGRSYDDFQKVEKKYNIKYNYLIINHGASIIKNEEILYNICIDNDFKEKLIEILNIKDNYFACSGKLSRVDINHTDITKINLILENAKNINDYLNKNYCEYIKSFLISDNTIEIVSSKVGKEIAIKALINILEINDNDVYTIGDSYSDIEMIKNYNGYCMTNSIEELKQSKINKLDSVSELIESLN